MATRTISTKLQLDGEAEYRASLKNINSELGTLKSELKLTESQFAGHLNSYAALSAKGETLAGMYDQQEKKLAAINKILSEAKDAQSKFGNEVQSAKDKIAKTEAALNALADAEGDTSEQQAKLTAELEEYKTELATAEANQQKATEAVNKYQTQANSAEAELNKLGNEIDENNKCMDEAAKSSDKCADSVDKYSGKVKKADEDTEKFSEKLKTGLVAGATAAAAAFAAISAAAVKLGVEVVTAYADYEQLVGGVETLFKDSAGQVEGYANNAYKTAGMSANQYMNTVTGFSASLLQSLDGDTKAAAEKADMAITDMSDNANKMGTSIDSIQTAYQGFAKQNYTMLDNLKLGYGGTKEEMQRLLDDATKLSGVKYDISSYADIVDAIHVVQTEMGITGTTAKEASTTIEGSINSTKAAWSNLLTGFANDEADVGALITDLCDSVATAANNLIPRVIQAVTSIVENVPIIIQGLAGTLTTVFQEGQGLITSLMQPLVDAFFGLINAAIALLPTLLPEVLNAAISLFQGILDGLNQTIPNLLAMLPVMIQNITDTLTANLPQIVASGIEILVNLINGITNAIPSLIQAVIDLFPVIVNSIMENLPQIIQAGLDLLIALINGIVSAIPQLIAMLPTIITTIVSTLTGMLPQIIQAGITLLQSLINGIISAIPQLIAAVPQIITSVVNTLTTNLPKILQMGIELIGSLISGLIQAIPALIAAVPQIISAIWDTITNTDWLSLGKNIIDGVIQGVKNAASSLIQVFKDLASSALEAVKDFFGIHSPSRVMRDQVGKMIPAGMAEGVEDGMDEEEDRIKEAMRKGVPTTIDSYINTKSGSASYATQTAAGGFTQNITINSPKELSPSEVARQTRNQTRQMVLKLKAG